MDEHDAAGTPHEQPPAPVDNDGPAAALDQLCPLADGEAEDA